MGNKQHRDAAEKDEHIAMLEAQIEVHAAHTSQMHARLLSTLDAMDALRTAHSRELKAERRAIERLSTKLDHYLEDLKRAEAKRDEMEEITSVLLEKVELSKDYALWPRSQIHLTSPLEPLHEQQGPFPSGDAKVLQMYASAVVASLQLELDAERRAHVQTRDQAESDLISLNAQLARREAELETCIVHPCHDQPTAGPSSLRLTTQMSTEDKLPPAVAMFTREEAIKVLEITAAKNHALEIEVKELVETLEKARQAQNTPEPQPVPVDRFHTFAGPRDHVGMFPSQAHDSPRLNSPSTPALPPSSPGLPPFVQSTQASPSPYSLAQNIANPSPHASPGQTLVLVRLEEQIKAFATEIDRFKTERDTLGAVLVEGRKKDHDSGTGGNPQIHLRQPSHTEEEYTRLVRSEDALRHELDAVRDSWKKREDELQREIETLQQALSTVTLEHSVTISAAPHANRQSVPEKTNTALTDILDDDKAEVSMELATPLQPTIISLQVDDNHRTDECRSSLYIPLPPSPSLASSTPPSLPNPQIVFPTAASPRPPRQAEGDAAGRLDEIERELALARMELEERDEALRELREFVGQLREMVEASEEPEPDGEQQRGDGDGG